MRLCCGTAPEEDLPPPCCDYAVTTLFLEGFVTWKTQLNMKVEGGREGEEGGRTIKLVSGLSEPVMPL